MIRLTALAALPLIAGCVETGATATSAVPDGPDTCGKSQLEGLEGTPVGEMTITVLDLIRAIPPAEVGQSDGNPSRLTLVVEDGRMVDFYCG